MMPLSRFLNAEGVRFVGLREALDALHPFSEEGRRRLRDPEVFLPGDEARLSRHGDRVAAAVRLFDTNPVAIDRIAHALRNLPRLDDLWEADWNATEFALLAAFRHYHGLARDALQDEPELAGWLRLRESGELGEKIFGSTNGPRFCLDASEDADLAAARAAVRKLEAEIASREERIRQSLYADHGLSPDAAQWVADRSDHDLLEALAADSRLVLVSENINTLRFGLSAVPEIRDLRADLSEHLRVERAIERRRYAAMATPLRKERDVWMEEARKLGDLDWLLAVADLSRRWKAVAPMIEPDTPFPRVSRGRHEILKERVQEAGATYQSLDLSVPHRLAILTGTNMGGKTVVLQTVGWLQALTQLGLPVPAESFCTRLFSGLSAITAHGVELGGLSAFGREIESLKTALSHRANDRLYLIDEPGRGTHVKEGRALCRAVLDAVAHSPSSVLVATHLDGLDRDGAHALTMKGLRRDEARRSLASVGSGLSLHALMDYRVESAGCTNRKASDALDVAELLGLERGIVDRARELLNESES